MRSLFVYLCIEKSGVRWIQDKKKAKAKLVELDKRVTSYAVGGIMCALIAVGSSSESFSKFSDVSHSSNQARRGRTSYADKHSWKFSGAV